MYVAKPPERHAILAAADPLRLVRAMEAPHPNEYVHWDKLRHLTPPDGISAEEWWLAIKWSRQSFLRQFPLTDPGGKPFSFALPDEVLRLLHYVDQRCSGAIAMP